MSKQTKGLIGILVVCIVLIVALSIELFSIKEEEIKEPSVTDTIVREEVEYSDDYYRSFYKSQKDINDDYVGQIFFKSGLIVQPFVQGETNDTYLRTDWTNGKYDVEGSNFMDMIIILLIRILLFMVIMFLSILILL